MTGRLIFPAILFFGLALVGYAGNDAPVAQKADMNAGPRLRLPSVDANVVPPLPFLAKPIVDRASLTDATEEMSAKVAVGAPMPRRTTPAPFVKIDLPDPFENRKAMRIPVNFPPESTEPMAGPLKPLKP